MTAVVVAYATLAVFALASPQSTCGIEPIAPEAFEQPALTAFEERVERYLTARHAMESSLTRLRPFDDAEDLFEARRAMQAAIRALRADAKPGDFMTADVGVLIRLRLACALTACGYEVDDVLASINEERMPGARAPRINEPFPWELGSAMWPTLLAVLPPLPEALQYRFSDRDLVIIDTDASLVVDILANALPAAAPQGRLASHRWRSIDHR